MNPLLKKIHEYLLDTTELMESDLAELDGSSVYLSIEIMEYAHRGQRRVNGERYSNHPSRVLANYRNLVGIVPDEYFCIDVDLMRKYGIPFEGVQEVCLLHDVIEDTELTMDDVRSLFVECGLGRHFDVWIKDALTRITHDKAVAYDDYIDICLRNPISAIVKMMDLQDNLRVIDLCELEEHNYVRSRDYLRYIYTINSVYNFVENNQKYLAEFKAQKQSDGK